MGTIIHHAILVTGSGGSREDILVAHAKAETLCPGLVSHLVDGMTNGYRSFFVAPDGSKEGWGESDVGDAQRQALCDWLNRQRWIDGSSSLAWILVEYGEGEAGIVRSVYDVAPADSYTGPHELDAK